MCTIRTSAVSRRLLHACLASSSFDDDNDVYKSGSSTSRASRASRTHARTHVEAWIEIIYGRVRERTTRKCTQVCVCVGPTPRHCVQQRYLLHFWLQCIKHFTQQIDNERARTTQNMQTQTKKNNTRTHTHAQTHSHKQTHMHVRTHACI